MKSFNEFKKSVEIGDVMVLVDCSNKQHKFLYKSRIVVIKQTNAIALQFDPADKDEKASWLYFDEKNEKRSVENDLIKFVCDDGFYLVYKLIK